MKKILIANRGEIAVRIIRACREMGISPVAVYSECDRTALHVRHADEAYAIGGSAPRDSYLRIDRILDAARRSGADAVHPGYGFLAENEAFARAVRDAGLTFIGPTPEAIALMGSKTAARARGRSARRAGRARHRPTRFRPATRRRASSQELARSIGYPLLVKAVSGGGGKGMRTVADPAELAGAVRAARSEAGAAFGDAAVYLERRLTRPRHIEVQLLGDQHGTVLPFVERECSIQRRHQKVVEETPSLAVTPALRQALTAAAAAVARAVGYTNAGTIEFLLDEDGRFYFLEMNTRLQVEHPITEMVTGVDLVRWQIRIARGERLDLDPDALLTPRGHAIECRIYAEDPDNNFLPSPGRILALRAPAGPGIRDDSGATAGLDVPIFYDPMISKLIAWAEDRPRAIARMRRALGEYVVAGIKTTVPFFTWLLEQPEFVDGRFHTTYLDEMLTSRNGRPFVEPTPEVEEVAVIAAALQAVLSPAGAFRTRGTAPLRRRGALEGSGATRGRGGTGGACRYEIEAGGRVRQVTVNRTGDGFAVSVDGRLRQVDAARIDAHTLSLIVDSRSSAGSEFTRHEATRPAGHARPSLRSDWRLVVGSASVPVTVTLNGRRGAGGGRARGVAGSGPQRIVAPMPGKVVRVLVKAGDAVRAASAGRRRRSDEDGKRAARRPRRHGGRNPRPRRDVGRRRRAAGRDSVKLFNRPRVRKIARYVSVCLMLVAAILAAAIVGVADGRSRAGRAPGAPRRKGRNTSSGRCTSAASRFTS